MASLDVRHEAGYRYRIAVRGHRIVVDQPIEAGGGDDGPTPTELFVASLASCIAFYAGRFLVRHGMAEGELGVDCDFTTTLEASWRVDAVHVRLRVPAHISASAREGALRAAEHCTVHNSLRWPPRVQVSVVDASVAPAGATR